MPVCLRTSNHEMISWKELNGISQNRIRHASLSADTIGSYGKSPRDGPCVSISKREHTLSRVYPSDCRSQLVNPLDRCAHSHD
jgi:hypothetical protein